MDLACKEQTESFGYDDLPPLTSLRWQNSCMRSRPNGWISSMYQTRGFRALESEGPKPPISLMLRRSMLGRVSKKFGQSTMADDWMFSTHESCSDPEGIQAENARKQRTFPSVDCVRIQSLVCARACALQRDVVCAYECMWDHFVLRIFET